MWRCLLFMLVWYSSDHTYYKSLHGQVRFRSHASYESIEARSGELKGVVDAKTNGFSFSVSLLSFDGFNSELQKDHYAENYVETEYYPQARFNGRIIEEVPYNKPGSYAVRAKGIFELHGVKQNKIIPSILTVVNEHLIRIQSHFELNLTEFNVKIPRLVHKKVAEVIEVKVDTELTLTP